MASKDGELLGVGFIFGVSLASLVFGSIILTEIRYYKLKRSDSYELLN